MVSGLIKNNVPAAVTLVIILLLAAFVPLYFHTVYTVPAGAGGVIYNGFISWRPARSFLLIISFFCVTGGAFYLNRILSNNETLSKTTFFPALLFAVFSMEALSSYELHPAVLANLCVLAAMMRMMKSYRVDDAKAMFYDGGVMISLASLFYFPAVTLIPLVFISLFILRPFVLRELLMAVLGILTPHFIALCTLYLIHNRIDTYYLGIRDNFVFSGLVPEFASQYFLLIALGFLFVLFVFNRLTGTASRKIRQQKNANILFFWLLLGVGSVFYVMPHRMSLPLLCIPPLSALFGEWLGNMRRNSLSDLAVFLLLSAYVLTVLQLHGVL